ncbi:hypothetical protein WR25_02349 [Diploscapter pachys]|uniref:Uncharacterized protein n=1 Tax=Diploscapter pachys TaxID=2018661 RepID=A0A2A2M3F0_9BILA|nr:hypothetical protein WR25_02349 [Diploscapter pachys]
MPIGPSDTSTQLLRMTKRADGTLDRCTLGPALFVPFTGGRVPPFAPRALTDRSIPLCFRAPIGDAVQQGAVAGPVGSGGDGDVPDHIPFHAIATAFQPAAAVALEPATSDVSIQAGRRRNVEQDEAGRPLQALREQPRVIAVHHPAVAGDRGIMERRELGWRSWHPVGVREMVELIEVDHLQAPGLRDRLRQRRLAAVRRPHDADACAQLGQRHGAA